jgi:hypothetical protein
LRKPACSHCDRGPASRPTRVSRKPKSARMVATASGSLATFASRMIRPEASRMQTLLCSKDTSIRA